MNAPFSPPASRIARLSSWLGGAAAGTDRRTEEAFVQARRDTDRLLFTQIGEFLAAHDLAPTVDHYRIARCYVAGEDRRISQAIDRQLASAAPVDAVFVERLIRDTRDPLHPERIGEMADALARRLDESETTVRQSHASARDFETALSSEATRAGKDPDGAVQRLLALTGEAIARTQMLSSRLEETHRETQQLRSNLQEAQRAADEDHLTGLPNRRSFDRQLRALAPQDGSSAQHCVALCDIDDFKKINDRHGHDAGDRVLKLIARHLTEELGRTVFVARHGGEEFACLFESCQPMAALEQLDAARHLLGARTLVNQSNGEGIGRLTFSAGIAALGDDPSGTMRAADAALYMAKRDGKNRIQLADALTACGSSAGRDLDD